MKNVDVPMWDKGDDTDDFTKGSSNSSSSSFGFQTSSEKAVYINELFELILGREPSSKEMSYYKYSTLEKGDIVKKLLEGEEHKNILEKSRKFGELKEEKKELESTILKLRSNLDDKESEQLEIKRLLVEKNSTIEELREKKNIPFLTNSEILEENDVHYSISKGSSAEKVIASRKNFLDRLLYLFFGDSE
jgi:hypothetical protein